MEIISYYTAIMAFLGATCGGILYRIDNIKKPIDSIIIYIIAYIINMIEFAVLYNIMDNTGEDTAWVLSLAMSVFIISIRSSYRKAKNKKEGK